jgi:hypothetical protein
LQEEPFLAVEVRDNLIWFLSSLIVTEPNIHFPFLSDLGILP